MQKWCKKSLHSPFTNMPFHLIIFENDLTPANFSLVPTLNRYPPFSWSTDRMAPSQAKPLSMEGVIGIQY